MNVEPTIQSSNSVPIGIQDNIASKRRKIKITVTAILLLIISVLFFDSAIVSTSLLFKIMPGNYSECLSFSGNIMDYEHNSYRCVWRKASTDWLKFNSCKAAKGNVLSGLVGCTEKWGCDRTPDTCEVVFYKDNFNFPKTFEECEPNSIMSTTKSPLTGIQTCIISIDLWGFNQTQAKSLYARCKQLGNISSTDDIDSDLYRGNCTLTFWKGRKL